MSGATAARSCRRKIGRLTCLAATTSCWRSRAFSATNSARVRSRSVASPPTIEHGRGRRASRIALAIPSQTVRSLPIARYASTRPLCPETSVSFKLMSCSEIFNDPTPEERGLATTGVLPRARLRTTPRGREGGGGSVRLPRSAEGVQASSPQRRGIACVSAPRSRVRGARSRRGVARGSRVPRRASWSRGRPRAGRAATAPGSRWSRSGRSS